MVTQSNTSGIKTSSSSDLIVYFIIFSLSLSSSPKNLITTFNKYYHTISKKKDRFCSKLNLPKEVKKLANYIVNKVNDIPTLTGRSPNSLAAAAIFLACDLTGNSSLRTAEEIGQTCGAAENTIKQTIKLMQPNQDKLLPPDFVKTNQQATLSASSSSSPANTSMNLTNK